MFDLLLKNVRLEDPINNISGIYDIAIENKKIADIEKEISPSKALQVLYFRKNLPYLESLICMFISAVILETRVDLPCLHVQVYAQHSIWQVLTLIFLPICIRLAD